MNKIFKYVSIIMFIAVALLIVTGIGRGFEQSKLYDKEEISVQDLKQTSAILYMSMSESSDLGEINMKTVLFSGVEHLGTIELEKNEGIDITCSQGNIKILIMDTENKQLFYEPVTELYYGAVSYGKYDIYAIGKWYTGKVAVKY